MRNKKVISILVSIIAIAAAIVFYVSDNSSQKEEYQEITSSKIKNLGNQQKEFVYVYGTNCSACKIFKPILYKATKKTGKRIYKVDYGDKDNRSILQKYNIYSTPTMLVIDKGKIINRYEGARELSETIKILQQE